VFCDAVGELSCSFVIPFQWLCTTLLANYLVFCLDAFTLHIIHIFVIMVFRATYGTRGFCCEKYGYAWFLYHAFMAIS